MKDWAVEKGATHFTHWFQPMTGITAEKHDSFISPSPDGGGHHGVLRQGADSRASRTPPPSPPAACARPLRPAATPPGTPPPTPSSRASTLCIPTAFCSYGGEALDKKTPLLRSMEALNTPGHAHPAPVRQHDGQVRRAPRVGPEQEYFLVDKEMYDKRRDLVFTRPDALRRQAAQGPGAGRPLLRRHQAPGGRPIWRT